MWSFKKLALPDYILYIWRTTCKLRCLVNSFPTDVLPNESSRTFCTLAMPSLDEASPGRCVPWTKRSRTIYPFMGVGLKFSWEDRSGRDIRGSFDEVNVSNYVGEAQIYESSCCANPAVQDRDTSVRDTLSKGRIIQGTERTRILVWGHILMTSKLL